MTRVTVLSATIAILLCMWVDNERAQPTWLESLVPKVSQVDWCVIDELAAGQDQAGVWHKFWSQGYGPCFLQDKFRNI